MNEPSSMKKKESLVCRISQNNIMKVQCSTQCNGDSKRWFHQE